MDQQSEIVVEIPRAWDRPVVSVPVLACLALVGGHLPSFSTQANLYVLAMGGVLIWFGLSRRVPRPSVPDRMPVATAWWLLPMGIFGFFEGTTFMLGSSDEYPTFSRLADPLLDDELIRSVVYFGWLGAFWGLVRR